MKRKIMVDVGGVDWKLLRKQKTHLLDVVGELARYDKYLDGLVHLIDDIQDQAAEVIGEEQVFGKL